MLSIAEQLFNSFSDEESLKETIKRKQIEGLYLEFKQKKDTRNGELDDDDKRNFSDGLSQFGNSDGGVQIWGIKTEKPGDFACQLKPIEEIDKFLDRLKSYLKDAVQPAIDGILIELIYKDEKTKIGYIKILIPRSDKTPHRSINSREYYKRNVQGKYRLEHFDLEDMFGRRQKPLLKIELKPKIGSVLEDLLKQANNESYLPPIIYELYVVNEGRAIGRDSMIILWFPEEKILKSELRLPNISHSRIDEMHGSKPTIQLNMNHNLFYPDVNTRIGEVIIQFHKDHLKVDETSMKWVINADNMLKQEGVGNLLIEAK